MVKKRLKIIGPSHKPYIVGDPYILLFFHAFNRSAVPCKLKIDLFPVSFSGFESRELTSIVRMIRSEDLRMWTTAINRPDPAWVSRISPSPLVQYTQRNAFLAVVGVTAVFLLSQGLVVPVFGVLLFVAVSAVLLLFLICFVLLTGCSESAPEHPGRQRCRHRGDSSPTRARRSRNAV